MDDRNAPATKGDIAGLNERLEQLRAEVNRGYADILERMSDGETRLLKAFYDFAQSNQKRITGLEATDAGIRSRLATVEDRPLQVEKRLNLPPVA